MNGSVTTPKDQGTIAFYEGKSPNANPYQPFDPAYDDWMDGYELEIEFLSEIFDECYGTPKGNA